MRWMQPCSSADGPPAAQMPPSPWVRPAPSLLSIFFWIHWVRPADFMASSSLLSPPATHRQPVVHALAQPVAIIGGCITVTSLEPSRHSTVTQHTAVAPCPYVAALSAGCEAQPVHLQLLDVTPSPAYRACCSLRASPAPTQSCPILCHAPADECMPRTICSPLHVSAIVNSL